jgi:hypothetical protein
MYLAASEFWRKRKYATDKGFVGGVECWDLRASLVEVGGRLWLSEREVVGGRLDLYICDETWYCLDFTIVAHRIVGEWVVLRILRRAHVLCGL